MTNKKFFLEYLLGFSLFLVYLSIYQVADTENAMRISNIHFLNQNSEHRLIKKPGLHFKWPLLERVVFLDKREQRTLIRSNPLIIQDSDTIRIDYLINWRIKHPHRYVEFISHNQADWPTLLTRWSNQFLQRHWIRINIEKPVTKQFDSLSIYLSKRAAMIGIEIISCHILQKIPTTETKKNILQKLYLSQTRDAQEKLHQGQLRVRSIESQAKIKQAMLYTKAKMKIQNIQNEGELLAMQTYLNAYNQAPKFAAFYQNLQGEALAISQNPEFSLLYQNLRGYVSSFETKMPNTAVLNMQTTNAAL